MRTLTLKRRFYSIKKRIPYKRAVTTMRLRPVRSFLIALGVLLLIIILGSVISNLTRKPTKTPEIVKAVHVYRIGAAAKMSVQARVQKSGVVTIVAQSAGIINQINIEEGAQVGIGANLLQLASNYQGGNAQGLQAELAQKQYENVVATYDTQKDVINKQRDVANKTNENTDELRKISEDSLNDTRGLLSANQDLLTLIDQNITNLQNTNTGGVNDQAIFTARQGRAQVQSAVVQLQSQVRSLEYQTNTDKPLTQLANLQKDITLKQLDIQEKALDLNKEASRIQLNLAYINASLMHPTSPIAGVVDRVHVKLNQAVTPGMPLVTITGDSTTITAVAQVTRAVAQTVSRVEMSALHIGSETYTAYPAYVSQNATDGQLYAILYSVPASYAKAISDSEFITVEIPVTSQRAGTAIPYIPIDSVYQTPDEAFVYVVEKNRAVSRKVKLGALYGDFVEVLGGLRERDSVIIDRTVVGDDKVTVSN